MTTEDYNLSADELDAKYNPDGDGEHPLHSRWDWRQKVAQQKTISGYWEWVRYMLNE